MHDYEYMDSPGRLLTPDILRKVSFYEVAPIVWEV